VKVKSGHVRFEGESYGVGKILNTLSEEEETKLIALGFAERVRDEPPKEIEAETEKETEPEAIEAAVEEAAEEEGPKTSMDIPELNFEPKNIEPQPEPESKPEKKGPGKKKGNK
jgi:hypothetical protein